MDNEDSWWTQDVNILCEYERKLKALILEPKQ